MSWFESHAPLLKRPLFLIFPLQVTLAEHTPAGAVVVTVTATDRDAGENGRITYSVMSSTQEGFHIDPNNGRQAPPPVGKSNDGTLLFSDPFFWAFQDLCSSATELSLTPNALASMSSWRLATGARQHILPSPRCRFRSLTSTTMPPSSTNRSTGQFE